jgi:trans-feruloyl-CoA hydratase/vanillin synthase
METLVLAEVNAEKKVGYLTLNRPEKRNALSQELISQYLAGLADMRADDNVRVIVTRANGKAFSAGMDLLYLREAAKEAAHQDWDTIPESRGHVLSSALGRCPKITIAAVNGYCLGGGVGLMMSHDLVVAANEAQIGLPEILRGSFGQGVTSQLIHSQIPIKKVVALQLLGRNISGAEAAELGLASFSTPSANLTTFVDEIAGEIGLRSPALLAHAKIAVELDRQVPMHLGRYVDHLVAMRMNYSVDPFANLDGYLNSQRGGTNQTYEVPTE